ncbi:MAG: AAA family ATPase [Hyphomonadaceae bacterium]|nr:AAA family ATPase [Hyphomonadaceae bacterium]
MTTGNVVHIPPAINITRWGACSADGERGECSSSTLMAAQADLARSGLTLDDARANGMYFTDDASVAHPDFAAHPATIIPYTRMDGSQVTYKVDGVHVPYVRCRYLPVLGKSLPKDARRYDAPRGSGSQIYVPQALATSVLPDGALCIGEGEKKAAALSAAGIPCVAIGGVDSVRESKAVPHALHPDLVAAVTQFSDVCIIFDSDIATNPNVGRSEQRLATLLALLGLRVRCVRLPASGQTDEHGKPIKVGADDFLAANGAEALRDLIVATPALGERPSRPLETIPTFDLLGRDVHPVEELVPGLIQKGVVNFIAAPGGSHKSRLAMQMTMALNVGANVFGKYGEQAGCGTPSGARATMVLVAAEDDENELARRAQAIAEVLELPPPARPTPDNPHAGGVFLPMQGKDSALVVMGESAECLLRPFYHDLLIKLQSIPGHKVVVLDSAYDVLRFKNHGKIDEDSVNFAIKVVLQGICDSADCTIIMPWHPSQAGSGRQEMDGFSVAWHNSPRVRLVIEPTDKEDEYELRVAKRNHGPKGVPIKLRFYRGALLPTEVLPQAAQDAGALREAVVRAALGAAELGTPFNKRDTIPEWAMKEVDKATGRRPTQRAFREEVQAASRDGQLMFLPATRHRSAGFYPPNHEQASALARDAKKVGES